MQRARPRHGTGKELDLKVVTWNCGFWQHRSTHDAAWTYLRNQIEPDLALLQEVNSHKLGGNECLHFRGVHQDWGTAVYTRNMPIEPLTLAEKYSGRVSAASMEISPGHRCMVASIHAPIIRGHVFPYLNEIFSEIESKVEGKTFIVGGDLNAARLAEKVWPGYGHGPFFDKLAHSVFFDCHQHLHGREEQTFFRKGSIHPFQDDHLFVSHDLEQCVRSCYVLDNEVVRGLSDHAPLVAEIET